jgi:hypothetical protein
MAIEDYIPNVFGSGMPSYIPGLLGQEETAALQKRANVQGLLGAALSLAQGMSPQGPRRSAAQNILGAIAGGLQAGQGAYQGAVQNYMTQQQLANAILQQRKAQMELQGRQAFAEKYPDLAPIAALSEAEAAKVAGERSLTSPLANIRREVFAGQSAAPATSMQAQPANITGAVGTPVVSAVPQGVVDVAPAGQENVLPAVPVVSNPANAQLIALQNRQRQLNEYAQRIQTDPTLPRSVIKDELDVVGKELTSINNQLSRVGAASYDFDLLRNTLPKSYEGRIAAIETAAMSGGMDIKDVQTTVNQLYKEADITTELQKNYQFAKNQGYKGTLAEFKRISAPQTNLNVGDKVLQGERAKAQSRAEESAINAQNAASDVSAIIDILRPYRGGALQDFAGSIGAYLPGTELEKLATAKQAAEAIRAKLAPTLRVEGSGATSDFEIKSFLSAIPSLFNTTEGRDLMATYAQRLADRSVAAADIRARLTEEGRYSIKNFQEELRKSGLDRVFSNEDIQRLRGKAPVAGGLSPEGQKAFEKYRPR